MPTPGGCHIRAATPSSTVVSPGSNVESIQPLTSAVSHVRSAHDLEAGGRLSPAIGALASVPERHSAAQGRDQRGRDEDPDGLGDPVTERAKVNERCSALLISLLVVGFTSVRSARNSDHPSAYQLVLTADRDVRACPYFSLSKTQRRTIDVLSEKTQNESRI